LSKCEKIFFKFKGALRLIFSYLLLRYTRINKYFLAKSILNLNVDKLHVGCGKNLISGWLNIKNEKYEEYGRVKKINDILVLNFNLIKKWPFAAESIQSIAGSHFIEHLDLNKSIIFFQEAFRVMKQGGIIWISCPNLRLYAENYANNNRNFFENPLIKKFCVYDKAATPGEIFMAKAYDCGRTHEWFYDFESLKHILEISGFSQVKKKKRLDSQIPDIDKIELAEREIETLYVEAVK